jgi:hypothetical protein
MSAQPMNAKLPIRKILVLAANPQDTSGLRLDEEVRSIQPQPATVEGARSLPVRLRQPMKWGARRLTWRIFQRWRRLCYGRARAR